MLRCPHPLIEPSTAGGCHRLPLSSHHMYTTYLVHPPTLHHMYALCLLCMHHMYSVYPLLNITYHLLCIIHSLSSHHRYALSACTLYIYDIPSTSYKYTPYSTSQHVNYHPGTENKVAERLQSELAKSSP